MNDLVASFINDVGVTGSVTTKSIRNLDTSTHVISRLYAVSISSIQEFLSGLATWMDALIEEVDDVDQNNLHQDIGLIYVTACDRIDSICVHCDHNNNLFANPISLLPILLHELVKLLSPNIFARFVNMHFVWSIVIQLLKSILSLTSTRLSFMCIDLN